MSSFKEYWIFLSLSLQQAQYYRQGNTFENSRSKWSQLHNLFFIYESACMKIVLYGLKTLISLNLSTLCPVCIVNPNKIIFCHCCNFYWDRLSGLIYRLKTIFYRDGSVQDISQLMTIRGNCILYGLPWHTIYHHGSFHNEVSFKASSVS